MNLTPFEKIVLRFMMLVLRFMRISMLKQRYPNTTSPEHEEYLEKLDDDMEILYGKLKVL